MPGKKKQIDECSSNSWIQLSADENNIPSTDGALGLSLYNDDQIKLWSMDFPVALDRCLSGHHDYRLSNK